MNIQFLKLITDDLKFQCSAGEIHHDHGAQIVLENPKP